MSVPKISLKAARVNAGLNQIEAAKCLGISVETLSNYERGRSFPDVIMLKKLEDTYGVNYENLLFFLPN